MLNSCWKKISKQNKEHWESAYIHQCWQILDRFPHIFNSDKEDMFLAVFVYLFVKSPEKIYSWILIKFSSGADIIMAEEQRIQFSAKFYQSFFPI